MNDRWKYLLTLSAPTFAREAVPPYGFTTSLLSRLREQERETELAERIGLRALFASLVALVVAGVLAVSASYRNQSDLEPGVRSIVQVENVPLS
jgi:hypothetical protein